ncbi:hypothetical protein [Zavarzinella formosa]|uniref:hypothetical protein n=1 Tax=Zavarzinella formosa TaxID=360055 RepID=UPI0002ECFD28|nr:hypothetical protein [Zavarzinella formosa]
MSELDEILVVVRAETTGYEKDMRRLPDIASASAKKIQSSVGDAQKEINNLQAEGQKLTLANLSAYEKLAVGTVKAHQLMAAGVIDQTTHQRELKRLLDDYNTSLLNSIPLIGRFVGALSAAALGKFALDAVRAVGAMQDLADKSGVSAGFLSGLKTESENAGGSIEQLAQSIVLMNSFIGEAAKGSEEAERTLNQLGTSFQALRSLSPEQQFLAIADGISKLPTQFERTEAARAVFGRGITNLIPIISQGRAKLEEMGKAAGTLNNDQIAAIDAMQDRWNKYINYLKNTVAGALASLLPAPPKPMTRDEEIAQYEFWRKNAEKTGQPMPPLPSGVSADRPATVAQATRVSGYTFDANGNLVPPAAPGSGTGGGSKPQEAQDYDTISHSLDDYLDKLRTEHDLLGMNERDRAGQQAVLEAQNIAMKQGTLLTEDQITQVRDLALSNYDLKDSMKEVGDAGVISAKIIKDSFGDALESAMFDFKNFGAGASSVLEGIAKDIARKNIIDPLSSGASDLFSKAFGSGGGGVFSSIGSMLGFADGGSPPVGVPSIVGERGPEIFVPKTAGTIIPNNALGGSSPTVNITNVFQSGVTRQELATLMPVMVSQSKQAVFEAIERGGSESRSVNRRS